MYKELMEKLYEEYEEFKSQELGKPPERIFKNAFVIAEYETILSHYEMTLEEQEASVLQIVCQKGIETPNLLEKTYEHSLGNTRPIMDEEDFRMFLEEYFLDG